jgi:hypothetical protein
LLSCVGVAAACSGKVTQAGGLEVKIFTTNLSVGTDFDELVVDVAQETQTGWQHRGGYMNTSLPPSFPFPTSIAVAAGPGPDENTRITVTAFLAGNPVVRSEAQTAVPTDQVLELDMYLTRTCLGMLCDANAASPTTCVNGTCTGIRVPTSMLVAYTPLDNGGGGSGGTGTSSGVADTDASLGGHADGGNSGGGSGGGVDSGTIGPACDQTACGGGCCDPKGGCVAAMSTCSNGMACTGPGGTCTGSSTCNPQMAASVAASCNASHGCYAGGCMCMSCPAGWSCINGGCATSGFADGGSSCNAMSCSGGCCDANGACMPPGSACPSGGTCNGSNGAPCTGGAGMCAAGGACATGCCAGTGACISVGAVCPNGRTCMSAGTTCQSMGTCGAAGQPCCQPGNTCVSGASCNAGMCSAATTTCSISSETIAGTPNLNATISNYNFTAADGFVVLSGSTSGPMQAMFYFSDYTNACGYAMANSAKSGGKYLTFGVSQTTGAGYQSLIGSFVSGGANLGPALTLESATPSPCTTQYDVSGACGSGQLIIHITSASATSVTGYLSGACSNPDKMVTTGNFTLPVCNTSLSVQGTSACCP